MATIYQCDECKEIFERYGDGYHLYHCAGESEEFDGTGEVAAVVSPRTQGMYCSMLCLHSAVLKMVV